ncbi:unnamed protein product [Symbiodinium sp. CCMP2592]|nr:unnamed protein product [Symbiodinium sp. CCMP2592]
MVPPGFMLHGFMDQNLNGVYVRSHETTPGDVERYFTYWCVATGTFAWWQEKKQRYCVSFPTDPIHGNLWQRVKTGEEWAVAWYRPKFGPGPVGDMEDRWMEVNPETGVLDLHPRGVITYNKLDRPEVFAYLRAHYGSMPPPEPADPPALRRPATNPYTPNFRTGGNVTPTSSLPALPGNTTPPAMLGAPGTPPWREGREESPAPARRSLPRPTKRHRALG